MSVFCVFICYRFRGLNQFEEGRIVTKYVFRIVCSVRVCTENINLSALFCFLLFAFVCQSSFSFSYSFLFLHSFSSIHFNWFRLTSIIPLGDLVSSHSRPFVSYSFVPYSLVSYPLVSFRSKCHFKVQNLNPPLLQLQQQAANRSLDQILLLRCPYINLQSLHLSHLSPMSRYHK